MHALNYPRVLWYNSMQDVQLCTFSSLCGWGLGMRLDLWWSYGVPEVQFVFSFINNFLVRCSQSAVCFFPWLCHVPSFVFPVLFDFLGHSTSFSVHHHSHLSFTFSFPIRIFAVPFLVHTHYCYLSCSLCLIHNNCVSFRRCYSCPLFLFHHQLVRPLILNLTWPIHFYVGPLGFYSSVHALLWLL